MVFDAESAKLFLGSETEWDAEPNLSDVQQDFLLTAALATTTPDTYTIQSIGAAVYLGLRWKLAKAIEYHKGTIRGGESVIFDHLQVMLDRWAWAADSTLGSSGNLELFELEVGANFG